MSAPLKRVPFDLFLLTIEARIPSDIRNWRVHDDETESVRPIPKSPSKPGPVPAPVSPTPDPFYGAFHSKAKELLAAEDYAMIMELAKESH
jgi:hypothetical protein